MRRPTLQLLLALCFVFLFFVSSTSAWNLFGAEVKEQQPVKDEATTSEATRWQESRSRPTNAEREGYSDAVNEATALLRMVKAPTVSKLARLVRKPKGFIGNTVYYAKEAFVLLFMNAPKQTSLLTTSTSEQPAKISQPLARAVKILEDAAEADDRDALFLLAEMNFYGNYTYPINYDEAFFRYKQLAFLDGNSTAQYMLGFMYSTGLAPSYPSDQAKSMLYHTFAAEGGNTRSEMTLAYRHLSGIATPRNCDEAVHWYKKVADKAIAYYRSGPPGGRSLVRDAYRIADELGGVYGEGASVSSAGMNAKQGGPTSDAYADVEDVLEFLYLQSSKGDLQATFGLARLYYEGARGFKRDFKLAKKYFMELAREYWGPDGQPKKEVSGRVEKLAAKAAGYLGRMFLRGEGMEQSYKIAQTWFKRGIANGDALSQYSMGLIHLDGLGVQADAVKAAQYFSAAADQDLAVAQTNLGMLFLDQGDTLTATRYFDLAARNSHIEAFYYLAEMNDQAIGRERSCGNAAVYYKIVAEKAEAIWSSLGEAADAYEDGDNERAIIGYLMAAEQGSESAQANVAWLLDQSKPRWSFISWLTSFKETASNTFGSATLALIHWTRSAKQQNIDSLVKMGDYHLHGLGTVASAENAAACYQAAVETAQSAQAMWNLGWMHENGVGIEQDFHLAKRFYDLALDTNREAYVPVQLSLFRLRWRSWWNRITRGNINGIEEEAPARKPRSFAEWLSAFLEADAQMYQQEYEADDWDTHEHIPGDEYWDEDGEYDESLVDTLVLGGLVLALGWLLYYRQQQRRRAVEQRLNENGQNPDDRPADAAQQQQQPADRGLFPQPGQPAWNDWVAGGIGL